MFIRKKKLISLLSRDLTRMGVDVDNAGNRHDWDATTEAYAKIEYIQELIGKVKGM
jgi:hypothetical protein